MYGQTIVRSPDACPATPVHFPPVVIATPAHPPLLALPPSSARTTILVLLAFLFLLAAASFAALPSSPNWTSEGNQAWAEFGSVVSTAGDVNGDGYSDVIVGAPGWDNGQTDEGRALVFLGSAGGVAVTPAWSFEPDQASAYFGHSVATAGDVNADGFDDILVGAWSWSNPEAMEGRAFLFLGASGGPSTSPSWTWESNQAGARGGSAVSTAGDVNGDGYDDVLVGAMWYDNGQTDEGAAFLFLGSPGGLTPAFAWMGESNWSYAWFGYSLSTAGDVNADGYADVIIGAPEYGTSAGRAYGFYGNPAGLPGAANWIVAGGQSGARFGASVALAGDTSGDGYSEVIIGAPGYDNGQVDEGMAYIYPGSPIGLTGAPGWTYESNQTNGQCGSSVFTAGDINGDSRADAAVGVCGYAGGQADEGRVLVFYGMPGGPPGAAANWSFESNQSGACLGCAVGAAGDVNGDGFGDLIAGALWYDNGQEDEGRAFVWHGGGDGISALAWQAESDAVNAWFGRCVAPAGDVNGDGLSDLAVSAYKLANPDLNEGRVYVYLGTTSGPALTPSWQTEGNQAGAFYGYSVATAGDVNGDGYDDLLVSATGYDNGQADEGKVFLYAGGPGGLAAAPAWTYEGNLGSASIGTCVAGAGDVNGDGYADVIIGAAEYDGDGAAFVFHGSATGLGLTPARTLDGGQAQCKFGWAVAGAGDVNRDGFSDVIVGAQRYDSGQTDEGKVFVHLGSVEGIGSTPAWTAEGNQAGAQFGFSVAGAGDVNGDGYSDVLIGANVYDNGQQDEGRVFAYHGSASGLGVTPAWTVESDQVQGEIGVSVAGLGDVNLDGFSDVACGASLYTNGEMQEGRAWVYHGSPGGLLTTASWSGEGNQVQALFGYSVCGPGDVNGDGFGDLAVSAPWYDNGQQDEGRAFVYFGSGMPGGATVSPLQWRIGNGPIALLGASDDCCSFRLRAYHRTAYGRNDVRMEWNDADLFAALATAPLEPGAWWDTGAPVLGLGSAVMRPVLVEGATMVQPWHWRLRLVSRSPHFPRTPWFSAARAVPSEKHLRVGLDICDAAETPATNARIFLAPPEPNPLRGAAILTYELPQGAHVHLAVYDAAGRRLAVLCDSDKSAGRHEVAWDRRGAGGEELPAGVYFAHLAAGRCEAARKLVVLP